MRPGRPSHYRVVVEGDLGDHFGDLFAGMRISHEDGKTVITGPVQDQAHLTGTLAQIQTRGLALISVTEIEPPTDAPAEPLPR